jgi:sec-independent protein translocase protein TatA
MNDSCPSTVCCFEKIFLKKPNIQTTIPSTLHIRRQVMVGELFSPMHLLVILVIALIVFGPGKLPELGSSLGKAIKEFKKVMNDPEKSLKE